MHTARAGHVHVIYTSNHVFKATGQTFGHKGIKHCGSLGTIVGTCHCFSQCCSVQGARARGGGALNMRRVLRIAIFELDAPTRDTGTL